MNRDEFNDFIICINNNIDNKYIKCYNNTIKNINIECLKRCIDTSKFFKQNENILKLCLINHCIIK